MNCAINVLYQFTINLKIRHLKEAPFLKIFPNASELTMKSKKFSDIKDSVLAVNTAGIQMAEYLNRSVGKEKYKILVELNPDNSGQETVTKVWDRADIAKVWIVDGEQYTIDSTRIIAVGVISLYEIHEDIGPFELH
jgi:hypothetical protein